MGCDKKDCKLAPQIEKYFAGLVSINNCGIVKDGNIHSVCSSGQYYKGEAFLDILVKNYCVDKKALRSKQ